MDPTIATAEPRPALWEDLVDILHQPRTVFSRREGAGYGWAMVVLAVLMGVLFYAAQTTTLSAALDAELARAVQEQDVPPEALEGMPAWSTAAGAVGVALFFPLAVLLVGAALWLAGKIFGSVAALSATVMVATFAEVPMVLGQLLVVLQGLVFGPVASFNEVAFGPARFVDPDAVGPVVLAILGMFDVFTIWSTVLLAIGLEVVGRISRGEALLAAALVWLVSSLPGVVGAAM